MSCERLVPLRAAAASLVAAVAGLAGASASAQPGVVSAAACGVERWTVKTLQDRPQLRAVKETTVAYLVTRPRPESLTGARTSFERNVFRVQARVTLVRPEDDGDLHLVLRDAQGRHMIGEAPSYTCTAGATPYRRQQMKAARSAVRLCPNATVTGVAFFDFKHGQTGVAPNAIELHPILRFACASG
jgi:hypothetical protein